MKVGRSGCKTSTETNSDGGVSFAPALTAVQAMRVAPRVRTRILQLRRFAVDVHKKA